MLEELKSVLEYKEFLLQFTGQQLKTRYRGSVLGFVWTLMNPILVCLALSIVFSYMNKWDLRTAGLFFFAGTIVVLGYMAIIGAQFSAALLILPLGIVLFSLFVLGIAFIYSALNVFLRDFQFLWGTVAFLWFFFTPILFPITALPAAVRPYFEMNPVLPFLRFFQEPICSGVWPSIETFGLAALYSVMMLGAGMAIFFRSERSFYLYL